MCDISFMYETPVFIVEKDLRLQPIRKRIIDETTKLGNIIMIQS